MKNVKEMVFVCLEKKMKNILAAVLLMMGTVALSAAEGKPESIENRLKEKGIVIAYPGWKLKALAFSYDDGNIADRRLVAIFNRYGMKGTFHIPSAWLKKKPQNRVTEAEIKNLYAGHEISGHGANHLSMPRLPQEKLEQELDEEIANWKRITGKRILGYAYPYGSYSDKVIAEMKKRNLLYSRTVARNKTFDLPADFLRWNAQGHHKQQIDQLAEKYLALDPKKMTVLLIWGHSYEFAKADNWQIMEDFCKKMSGKKDIYYAAMGEIASYVLACRDLKISADGKSLENPSGMKIYFIRNGKQDTVEPGKSLPLQSGREKIIFR